jgi:hypothetical protein
MERKRRPETQPFTLAVCTVCGPDVTPQLLDMLRDVVRRCPHGVLAMTECLLGRITCATRPGSEGAMLLLQLCSAERTPTAPARWLGPVLSLTDAQRIGSWIARCGWQDEELPARLRAEQSLLRSGSRN